MRFGRPMLDLTCLKYESVSQGEEGGWEGAIGAGFLPATRNEITKRKTKRITKNESIPSPAPAPVFFCSPVSPRTNPAPHIASFIC